MLDWEHEVLRDYFYQVYRLFLGINDLVYLQQTIFAATEQKILFLIDNHECFGGALFLMKFFTTQVVNKQVTVNIRANGNKAIIAEKHYFAIIRDIFYEI